MKKVGLVAIISFMAGALFLALSSGYFKSSATHEDFLNPGVVQAETVKINGNNFAPLVKKVRPAVVMVISEKMVEQRRLFNDDFFDRFFQMPRRSEPVEGMGSGFIISQDGYIITNNHVVSKARRITIHTIDKKEFTAKIIGTDPATDLALIKVKAKDLPFIELGDSDKTEIGEWVVAIGNPFYQDLSVTAGIVSGKGRQLQGSNDVYEDYIQTDAAINRGNSGGPLVNVNGKVIGINSAIIGPAGGNVGIGFAIPSNMAKKVIRDLKKVGRVIRGYLGISFRLLTETYAKELDQPHGGCYVSKVEKNSPAEKAGLKRKDIIIKLNGKKITSSNKLRTEIANMGPGKIIELTIIRENKELILKVEIGEAPENIRYKTKEEGESRSISLGMELIENSHSIAREFDLSTSRGLLVRRIEKNGPAYRAGLRRYDVILEVNGRIVKTVEDFRRMISEKSPGTRIMLFVNRQGEEGDVIMRLPE